MNRGLNGLEERVLKKNLCISCGACLSLCPYLRWWEGRVVKLHECGLEEGRCFAYCPRTESNQERVDLKTSGKRFEKVEIGPFLGVFMARAKDPFLRERAQSGGTVTALIDFAIRKKMIDAAILTSRDADLAPKGQIARSREDIFNCMGSSYVSGPTLEAIHKGPWQGEERIGVVGLPCQVQATVKMKSCTLERKTPVDRVQLIIGLFCTWALEYGGFQTFLKKRIGRRCIAKMEMTPPPERHLKIYTDGTIHKIPVDEVRPFIRRGCQICPDMTAELSDISAGTVEGMEGWNTIVIRSEQGEALFKEAEAEDIIEYQLLPEGYMDHLREASLLKKERAQRMMIEGKGRDG